VEGIIGNWFFYANWASLSAGEIISGQKYSELSLWQYLWVNILQKFKLLHSHDTLMNGFAAVNGMIAIEMIPLGRAFIEFLESNDPKWEDFNKILIQEEEIEHRYLRDAFKCYYDAFKEKDTILKIQMITLGSILQVFSEQTRVDNALKQVFDIKHLPGKLESFVQYKCTEIECYRMYNEKEHDGVYLVEDIKNNPIHFALKDISYGPLFDLYKEFGLIQDSGKIDFTGTGCTNWGELKQRKKFLAAMFSIYIDKITLFGNPHAQFKEINSLQEWSTFLEDKNSWDLIDRAE
jgi:hypothetical protein